MVYDLFVYNSTFMETIGKGIKNCILVRFAMKEH